jgi:hypothetical protein
VQTRYLSDIKDKRLLKRGNSILNRLFSNSVHAVRQLVLNLGHAQVQALQLHIADSSAIILSGGALKKMNKGLD